MTTEARADDNPTPMSERRDAGGVPASAEPDRAGPKASAASSTALLAEESSHGITRAVLVSARPPMPDVPTVRRRTRAIAEMLAERGTRVHWICPRLDDEHVAEAEGLRSGIDVEFVATRAPNFFRVKGRIADPPTELALATALRREPADIVHGLGFGGGDTSTLPWVSARLGFPALLDIEPARALCHRGDLIHADGSLCDEWMDPQRCFDCCRTSTRRGPSPRHARRWRMLQWMGGFSPYPCPFEFHNRRDLIIGCMQSALRIRVQDEEARDVLVRSGIQSGRIVVQPHDEVGDGLVGFYREALRAS